MLHLKANLNEKMKETRVVVKILTYPLHSEEPPKSTMFAVMKTSYLIQQHHTACIPANHITSLYNIN